MLEVFSDHYIYYTQCSGWLMSLHLTTETWSTTDKCLLKVFVTVKSCPKFCTLMVIPYCVVLNALLSRSYKYNFYNKLLT